MLKKLIIRLFTSPYLFTFETETGKHTRYYYSAKLTQEYIENLQHLFCKKHGFNKIVVLNITKLKW